MALSSRGKAIVLGAGLQGVCASLALAREGFSVALIDKSRDCLLRASLRNEGKIHLGFVYTNDRTFRTSVLMLHAALQFAPLIECWVGRKIDWRQLRSRPFVYGIPEDTMLGADQVREAFSHLQREFVSYRERHPVNYLGASPDTIFNTAPVSELRALVDPQYVPELINTCEVALDLPAFRSLLKDALEDSIEIEPFYGRTVEGVNRTPNGYAVEGADRLGKTWRQEGDIVVNCLWEGRLKIDRTMGIEPDRRWVYRLKYRMIGDTPAALTASPSLTLVVGPYGDLVVYPTGRTYLSWYPDCMQGWCEELSIPEAWQGACDGIPHEPQAAKIAASARQSFARIVPGLRQFTPDTIDAGVIFSWGQTDIDDPVSALHGRSEIGVTATDGYFSINTGKLTTAPLFAEDLVRLVRRL